VLQRVRNRLRIIIIIIKALKADNTTILIIQQTEYNPLESTMLELKREYNYTE